MMMFVTLLMMATAGRTATAAGTATYQPRIRRGVAVVHQGSVYPPPDIYNVTFILEWQPYRMMHDKLAGCISGLAKSTKLTNEREEQVLRIKLEADVLREGQKRMENKQTARQRRGILNFVGENNKLIVNNNVHNLENIRNRLRQDENDVNINMEWEMA